MKKFLALFCVLTLIMGLFAGCKKQESKDSKELFYEFMRGEITALDESGEAKYLDGGFAKILSNKYTYCFIDMTGDGKNELCVKNPPDDMRVFTVKDGKVYHWYFTDDAYKSEITLLNNGAFLSKNTSIYYVEYKYYELNENGKEKFSVTFSKHDEVYLALEDRTSPASYEIDSKKVTKEEYEEKTKKYLAIGSEKIVWYDKDGKKVSGVETEVGESLADKLTREIDGAYLEESKSGDSSTADMVETADKYAKKWQEVADEYYNKLMEYDGIIKYGEIGYTSDEFHKFIKNMKTSWEKYYAEQCENYGNVLCAIYSGGTIIGPIYADYEYNMQKDWALRLVKIYEQL